MEFAIAGGLLAIWWASEKRHQSPGRGTTPRQGMSYNGHVDTRKIGQAAIALLLALTWRLGLSYLDDVPRLEKRIEALERACQER